MGRYQRLYVLTAQQRQFVSNYGQGALRQNRTIALLAARIFSQTSSADSANMAKKLCKKNSTRWTKNKTFRPTLKSDKSKRGKWSKTLDSYKDIHSNIWLRLRVTQSLLEQLQSSFFDALKLDLAKHGCDKLYIGANHRNLEKNGYNNAYLLTGVHKIVTCSDMFPNNHDHRRVCRQTTRMYSTLIRHRDTNWSIQIGNYSNKRHYASISPTHLYEVLGLTSKASHKDIRGAYYSLSKLHHPDVNKSEESKLLFLEVKEAYEILGNKRKRRMYDRGFLNPTDVRSGHEASQEEDSPFTQYTPGAGHFKKRGPPPTGKTSIYDFDEFYKQHYQDVLEKKKVRARMWEERVKEADDKNKAKKTGVAVSLTLGIILIAARIFMK